MKAPSNGYRIIRTPSNEWVVVDQIDPFAGKIVWSGKTHRGARTAHFRLSVERATGKPVSYRVARRAGN